MTAIGVIATVDEFEQFIAQPENKNRLFELIDGNIIEKMPTEQHGYLAGIVVTLLNMYLFDHPIGIAGVEIRYKPEAGRGNDRMPDVSFRISQGLSLVESGAVPLMPDLAVEIKSPDDGYKEMLETAQFYLANGTRLVWLIYPERKLIEVLSKTERQLLGPDDLLTGGDVLPGFSAPTNRIFR